MSLERFLAIGPSKICPVSGMADIFQNGGQRLITNIVSCSVDQNTCDFAIISGTALRIEKVQKV